MEYTNDYLLDKQVKILQPVSGYRTSTDAVLLSSLPDKLKAGDKILDVGSGTGGISLCLAHRFPECDITGLEIQPRLAELSARSAAANGFANLRYVNCDIGKPLPGIANCSFHHVVTNPPYGSGAMPSPNRSKAAAHDFSGLDLPGWIAFCLKMMRPKGWLYMINKTDALDTILACLHGKTGAITVFPLYSKAKQAAGRILVRARKDSRQPTEILPGLVVHNDDGSYTDAAERILRHGERLVHTV